MTFKEAYDKGRNDLMAVLLWHLPEMSEENKEEIKKSYDPPKEEEKKESLKHAVDIFIRECDSFEAIDPLNDKE